jgi:sigma-B regulation protein RsbQ
MPAVTIEGDCSIFYNTCGEGPQQLVFVHGFRNSAESWAPVRDRLDPTRSTSWYLDLPGTGNSSTPQTWADCTIARYAENVHQFCQTLKLTDAVLIGHSLGGGTALQAALQYPDAFKALILVAPTPAAGISSYVSHEQLESVISPSDDQLVAFARAAFHRQPDHELFDRLLVTVRAASSQHVEGAMRSQHAFDVADQLAELSMPVLVVAGDRDRHIPVRHTLLTAAGIRRCGVQIYHNVGHAPFFEVPDEFVALLEGFVLTDLPVRARGMAS